MKKCLLAFYILLGASTAFADIKMTATVDRTSITEEDIITLSLTISGDGDLEGAHPNLPDLNDFEVMGSDMSSSSQSRYINGKFTFLKALRYNYRLSPKHTGVLKIGPATLDADGKVIKTDPITITVSKAGQPGAARPQPRQSQPQRNDDQDPFMQRPPGFDDEDDLFTQLLKNRGFMLGPRGGVKTAPKDDKNAFFISVEADKKKVYVGEQIVVTWYLYTRGNLSDFDALKYPELKGFWKEDLEIAQRLNFQQEVVNGIPYNRALLVSYAIFPISAGRKTIDQFKAKATVIDSGGSGLGVFGIGHPYTYVKTSQELPIEVVPLPTEGRPASFSGAVGKFNISGSLSSQSVKVNQPVSLKIRFQGRGNVKAIDLPPLNLPSNLEVYDTKKDTQFSKSGEASVEFEVLLIPRSVGETKIPPLNLSFFDPQAGKYVVKQTPEFRFNVLQGDPGQAASGASSPLSLPETSAPQKQELHFLKTSPQTLALAPNLYKVVWSLLFLIPLMTLFIGTWLIKARHVNADKNDTRKRAREKLKVARKKWHDGDTRSTGVEITNALLAVLAQVSGQSGVAMTSEEMMIHTPSLTDATKAQVRNLFGRCEVLSFAPEHLAQGAKMDKEILSDAEKVISKIFEEGAT